MQLFRVTDIVWDCDDGATTDDHRRESAEALGLPSSAYVNADDEDAVSNVLSDQLGYCVQSLNIEEVAEELVFPS